MKLVSYRPQESSDSFRIGFIIHNKVIDVQEAYRLLLLSKQKNDLAQSVESILPADPNAFFKMGSTAMEKAKEASDYIVDHIDVQSISYDQDMVSLGIPIPNPGKTICIGQNYADHVTEMKSNIPEHPVLFAKFSNALIGPEDEILKSPQTDMLDYEVELVIVIGKEASQVCQEEAYNYIAGYTIGNDITARDLQKRTPQWLQGKSLDRSTPIGPWVVTAEGIKDPANLAIRSYVNGEIRQNSNTNQLIFDIPFLIEFISNLITLQPGDIILTGTPHGVGIAMDPQQFLQAGDTVRLEIDQIGQLENMIVDKK